MAKKTKENMSNGRMRLPVVHVIHPEQKLCARLGSSVRLTALRSALHCTDVAAELGALG